MIDNIRYIARVFTQIGHSDKLGTGVRNVFNFFEPYLNSKKNVFNNDDVFITEGSLKMFFDNNELLNKRQNSILNEISKNAKIKQTELAEKYKVNRETIKRDLQYLQE